MIRALLSLLIATCFVFSLLLFSLGMTVPPLFGFHPTPHFVAAAAVAASGLCHAAGVRVFLPARRLSCGQECPHYFRFAAAAALVFFVIAASLALSHTFMAPNGLGVSGGKAKLLFVSGGIPEGFFTDPARATLQPAYPPRAWIRGKTCHSSIAGESPSGAKIR